MNAIVDCLPQLAKKHFINLRNIRLSAEREKFTKRISELRHQLSARGMLRSGYQVTEEWKRREEFATSLAIGYVQDAFATCELYDIPLTNSLCNCLEKATENFLNIQYQNAIKTPTQGAMNTGVPPSIRQYSGADFGRIMPQIRAMIEKARVEDSKKRAAMKQEKDKSGDQYIQHVTQHGGVMNASQTGNLYAQQLTVQELGDVREALAQMRAFFKKQDDSVENDERIGLLAGAEKAAAEKDESQMLGYLKQIPSKAWDIGKAVIPQVLLHYLKLRGLA